MTVKRRHKLFQLLSYFIFGLIIPALTNASQIDSLESVLKTTNRDTVKVGVLNELLQEYRNKRPDKALEYGSQALTLAQKLNYNKGIARSLTDIGTVHLNLGNYVKTINYYLRSLKIYEEMDDRKGIAGNWIGIGSVYWYQGNYKKSVNYYLKALEIYGELEDKSGIATSLSGIGIAYDMQEKTEEAISYYMQSLDIYKELGETKEIARTINNIGTVYHYKGNYEKAIDYFLQSLKMREEVDDKHGISTCLTNIGEVYKEQGDYQKAVEFIEKSLSVTKEIGDKNGIKYNYMVLSEIFVRKDQFKQAYEFYQLFSGMKDSLFNEEKSKEIGKLEAKYEMEKAEQELKRKEEEQVSILAEQTQRRNLLQYSGTLIFIVTLFITILFSGKLNIPIRFAEGGVFFTFLLVFEFLLVLTDPYIEQYTGGEPAYKLIINAGLAGLIFPLHSIAETQLKRRLFQTKKKIIKKRQKSIDT